jgi:hypothetical protein
MVEFPGIGLSPKQIQTTPANEDSGAAPELVSSRSATWQTHGNEGSPGFHAKNEPFTTLSNLSK